MIPKVFTSLHGHSGYSLGDGFSRPPEHITYVRENGGDSWALTDHGNASGFAEAWLHVRDLNKTGANFKFIGGSEMYLHPDIEQWKIEHSVAKEASRVKKSKKSDDDEADEGLIENEDKSKSKKSFNPLNRRHHLVVLPRSQKGLENLFTLVSLSFRDDRFYKFPRIDYRLLKQYGEDLIVSSACCAGVLSFDVLSQFPELAWDDITYDLLDDPVVMERCLTSVGNSVDRLVDCVGLENVYLELQFNRLGPQHTINRALIEFARRSGMNLIATCDSHYPRPELWKAREIYKRLAWMNDNTDIAATMPKTIDDLKCELYPKNAVQMWESYRKYCEGIPFYDDELICSAIERTHDIAHQQIGCVDPDTSVKLPASCVPEGKTGIKALYELCRAGLMKKGLDKDPVYIERLKTELDVIKKKKFERYFLLMKQIIDVAKKSQILGCGRGSAAGSLVLYLLEITQVDPIKHGLLFSRFLSMERQEYPDVDTDCSNRDKLMEDLAEHFGHDNVLYVTNWNTLKLKSLVKDVSKFFGVPFDEVNAVTAVVENQVKAATVKAGDDKNLFELTFEAAMEHSPPFKAFMDLHPDVCDHVQALHKQFKSAGRHAGGTLILDNPEKVIPAIRVREHNQSPWVEGLTLKLLGELGILKFDLLGLDTLRVFERCIEYIIRSKNERLIKITIEGHEHLLRENRNVRLTDGSWVKAIDLTEDHDITVPLVTRENSIVPVI